MSTSLPKSLRASEIVKEALATVQPTLAEGINGAALQAKLDQVNAAQQTLDQLNIERKRAANDKQTALKELNSIISRIRSAIRASYGPDSNEYEMFGGTRTSERKKRTSKS